jgi:hypothetical protein
MEEFFLPQGEVKHEIHHDIDVLFEEGALEIGTLNVVVEVNSCSGLIQELTE